MQLNRNHLKPLANLRTFFVFLVCISCFWPARADQLDDNLQTVWEVLWDQRGTPSWLLLWDKSKKVTYSIAGPGAKQNKDHIESAIKAVSDSSGVTFIELEKNANSQHNELAMLTIDVGNEKDFEGENSNTPCYAKTLKLSGFRLDKVTVKMRTSGAWNCAFHEMMHAMGLKGHPSGKTVLSYFKWRRDVLMDLDKLMLLTAYSDEMPKGATPLEALVVFSKAVGKQTELGLRSEEIDARIAKFTSTITSDMEKFAQGQGEVPVIVRRSGRASETHITTARLEMAYFLGLAAQRKLIKDDAQAVVWFRLASSLDHQPSQVMLARSYYEGRGVAMDKKTAYAWYAKLAALGNTFGKRQIATLETELSAEELVLAKAIRIGDAPTSQSIKPQEK